ncbi:MAG: transglutaminase-like cysteine peptidase [Rhizobiaceae bacterium]
MDEVDRRRQWKLRIRSLFRVVHRAAAAVVFVAALIGPAAGGATGQPLNAGSGRHLLLATPHQGASVSEALPVAPRSPFHTGSRFFRLAEQALRTLGDAYATALAEIELKPIPVRATADPAVSVRPGGVFDSVPISYGRLPALRRLKPSSRQAGAPALLDCSLRTCSAPEAELAGTLAGLTGAGLLRKIVTVNVVVNGFLAYVRDIDSVGLADDWATPQQTLLRQMGDCEDYAILKLALLEELGVPAHSLSLTVLNNETLNAFHAVAAIETDRGFFILDNMHDQVLRDIQISHYTPLYSLAAGRGYMHGRRIGSSRLVAGGFGPSGFAPGEGPEPKRVTRRDR